MNLDGFLTRKDAARYLTEIGFPISPGTLANHAVDGTGPDFRIWGRVAQYRPDDLRNWALARVRPRD